MFPNLIEDLTDGAVDHDYDLLYVEGYNSTRRDIASSQSEPATMIIGHNESGQGEGLTRNSKCRFDRVVTDGDGKQSTLSVYLVIRNPLKTATAAQVLETTQQLVDFLNTDTNAAKFIAGEI